MTHFFINKLSESIINEAKKRYKTGYTRGHEMEHSLQVFFNPEYYFQKDSAKWTETSDIPEYNASVKSSNCTLFVATVANNDRHIIDMNTSVQNAINHYIEKDASSTYFVVLDPTKWCNEKKTEQFVVLILDKNEMRTLLEQFAVTDRDSKLKNGKNCLRLKRTDDVLYKWYLNNRD